MHNPQDQISNNFEEAMSRMASDQEIISECRSIAEEFAAGEMDGLTNVE